MVGDLFEVWEIGRVSRCDVWISGDFAFVYFIVSRSLIISIFLCLMRYSSYFPNLSGSSVHLYILNGMLAV